MNYYIFDSIKRDPDGTAWGYKNGQMTEVFFLSADDTESELEEKGFAKCDAPDWNETMAVEETAWATL